MSRWLRPPCSQQQPVGCHATPTHARAPAGNLLLTPLWALCRGLGSDWHLESVEVVHHEVANKPTPQDNGKAFFWYDGWLTKDKSGWRRSVMCQALWLRQCARLTGGLHSGSAA